MFSLSVLSASESEEKTIVKTLKAGRRYPRTMSVTVIRTSADGQENSETKSDQSYYAVATNNRDLKEVKIAPETRLPPGYYTHVKTIGGHHIFLRSKLGYTRHNIALEQVGLPSRAASGATEDYVGLRGIGICSLIKTGNYYRQLNEGAGVTDSMLQYRPVSKMDYIQHYQALSQIYHNYLQIPFAVIFGNYRGPFGITPSEAATNLTEKEFKNCRNDHDVMMKAIAPFFHETGELKSLNEIRQHVNLTQFSNSKKEKLKTRLWNIGAYVNVPIFNQLDDCALHFLQVIVGVSERYLNTLVERYNWSPYAEEITPNSRRSSLSLSPSPSPSPRAVPQAKRSPDSNTSVFSWKVASFKKEKIELTAKERAAWSIASTTIAFTRANREAAGLKLFKKAVDKAIPTILNLMDLEAAAEAHSLKNSK